MRVAPELGETNQGFCAAEGAARCRSPRPARCPPLCRDTLALILTPGGGHPGKHTKFLTTAPFLTLTASEMTVDQSLNAQNEASDARLHTTFYR